jgi:hypothetical protein
MSGYYPRAIADMMDVPSFQLDAIGAGVFQFPCLTGDEADRILVAAKQLADWTAAPVRSRAPDSSKLREDVRQAWEITQAVAPDVFVSFDGLVRARARALGAQLALGDFDVSELRLVRYDPGGFFKVHTDTSGSDGRRIAIVIYLNDDFEGGATIFPLLGCRSVPRKGDAVAFPAERLHRGDVVTSGSKYILVCWLIDPPRGG